MSRRGGTAHPAAPAPQTGPGAASGSRSLARSGLRPGFMLVGILIIAANLRAPITVVGPLIAPVRDSLDLSPAAASILIALPVFCFAVLSPTAPWLGRRLGLERALLAALVALAVGILGRSLPSSLSLWLGTALIGSALAIVNVLLPSLVKREFPRSPGRITGVYSAVQSGTAAVASAIAVPIAGATGDGWRLSFGIWTGLALIAIGVFLPVLRHAGPIRAEASRTPGDARGLWRSPLVWHLTIFNGLQALLYYTVLTWWPTIERLSGVGASEAGLHQGVLQVVSIVSSLGAGWVLQRGGDDARPAVWAFGLPGPVGLVGQILFPGLGLLWVILLGFGIGGTFVVVTSLFSIRSANPAQTARLSSFALTCGYTLAALGPVSAGALASLSGTWLTVLLGLTALQIVQLCFGLLSGRPGSVDVR
ncbi:MFS transporter [Leucobacter weissii]|uniref:MFS transporter n=1 Tax=Leucobacter weissii TaxID=1983706 RepID=A0A939MLH8_9MICO|nr:MFS transporter [Leucobacter weissii]MBO1900832.1 MFS transporter [Leucobacter weissii]